MRSASRKLAFAARLASRARLAAIRKERGITQQTLAQRVGIRVVQLRRYESGASQPALDGISHLAAALSVSADVLLFGKDDADRMTNSGCSSKPCSVSTPETRKPP